MGRVCNAVAVVAVAAAAAIAFFVPEGALTRTMQVSNGYGAKMACSVVFVAGRTLESAIVAELTFPPIRFVSSLEVEPATKCVVARSRITRDERRACWVSQRLGCVLQHDDGLFDAGAPPSEDDGGAFDADALFPRGDAADAAGVAAARAGLNMSRIDDAVSAHFADSRLHARAFLLVRGGHVVYEQYGDGCGASTPLLGWSMTKSWINTLLGIRALDQGRSAAEALADQVPLAGGAVSVESLLRMSDGLDFDEEYFPLGDAPKMLFLQQSLLLGERGFRHSPSAAEPFRCFQYSSHSTNVLSAFLRSSFDSLRDYLVFPTERMFHRLGMRSAVMEPSPEGVFVGSSFGWATARDWARWGLLFLGDGVSPSTGERMLPEGWVDFSRSPTKTSSGTYAAHFWTHAAGPSAQGEDAAHDEVCDGRYYTRLEPEREWIERAFPPGAYFALGFEEQIVLVLPESDVIMVRLGQTKELVVNWDNVGFYSEIMRAIPDSGMPPQ